MYLLDAAMFISKVFPSCLCASDSDNDDSNLKQESDEDSDLGILAPHKNEKIFYVECFHRVKEIQVKMDFDTRCHVLPSSWLVTVHLSIFNILNNFQLLITMRRTDSRHIPIEGIVIVWFLNANGQTCPTSFSVNKAIPYCIEPTKYKPFEYIKSSVHESFFVNEHFKCLLTKKFSNEDSMFLPEDLLILKIQLFVRGCCDCKVDFKESKMHSVEECASKMNSVTEWISNMSSEPEGASKIHSVVEDVRKMHSAEQDESKIFSVGKCVNKMHSVAEDVNNMHSVDENANKMHFAEESASKMQSVVESENKMHSVEESARKMYSVEESASKMQSVVESASNMHSVGEGTNKMHSVKEGTSKMYFGKASESNMSGDRNL